MNKGQSQSKRTGGYRPNSGRKALGFQKKCRELAASSKFFDFAKAVFNREKTEPRLTTRGEVVYIEASVGDMVYLWEKLAAYGFGKPAEFDMSTIVPAIQQNINETQRLKLMFELNGIQGPTQANSDSGKLAQRVAAVQAGTASA